MIKTTLFTLLTIATAILLGVYDPPGSEILAALLACAFVYYLINLGD